MIIVNAEAVEATAATLSAAEALERGRHKRFITNEEAASLRQIVVAVATRDPATAQRLAAKKPRTIARRRRRPLRSLSASNPFHCLASRPPKRGARRQLVAAGCASVARLKAMPQEELKNLKDPRTGGRVIHSSF